MKVKLHLVIASLLIFFPMQWNFSAHAQVPLDPNRVWAVSWSPDETRIAVGFEDGRVEIHNVNTPSMPIILVGHSGIVITLAWHPTNSLLATGSDDGTVKLWNSTSGENVLTYNDFDSYIDKVSWSPDGDYLLVTENNNSPDIRVWSTDITYQAPVFTDTGPTAYVVEWHPSNELIAIGNVTGTVHIRDANSFNLLYEIGTPPQDFIMRGEQIMQLAWSPNGNYILTGSLGSQVILWNVNTHQKQFTLAPYDAEETDFFLQRNVAVWFNSSGNQFSALSGNGTLRTWSTSNGNVLSTRQIEDSPIYAAEVSPDGTKLAYVGTSGVLQVVPVPNND